MGRAVDGTLLEGRSVQSGIEDGCYCCSWYCCGWACDVSEAARIEVRMKEKCWRGPVEGKGDLRLTKKRTCRVLTRLDRGGGGGGSGRQRGRCQQQRQ